MSVDKKLLPMKGHFFLFYAGTAPLVPYLSTYARQLGFSSVTVGLIYTILPIFGLIAKPLFGVIADRYKIQKSLFILFQVITTVSFLAIYFVPKSQVNVSVDLDCGNGATVLKSCYYSVEEVDHCKVDSLGSLNKTAVCDMNCDMKSPKMWQTVCEHWHIPQYCYSNTNTIKYSSLVNNITLNTDKCVYISSHNVTLDGLTYTPHCRVGGGFVDINEPCSLNCSNKNISLTQANMTCINELLHFRVCQNYSKTLSDLSNKEVESDCEVSCDLDPATPWHLMEICEGWQADLASSCRPKTKIGEQFPSNLSFVGTLHLTSTIAEHKCVFVQLDYIELPDGSTHYPNCITKAQYQIEAELFHTSCEINCNNTMLNEIFQTASESRSEVFTQYTRHFWVFFIPMIISWIGQAVVVTFADAICFNLLGNKMSHYGRQRLWGSVGWGIFSLLTGVLIDIFSEGSYKDYKVAFMLMFTFMAGDIFVSSFLKVESTKMSLNILSDVGVLLSSLPTFLFLLWTIAVGLCTGLLWQFLFWHVEDVAGLSCDGSGYIKTLQGLISAIQTFCGEIPFLFISGHLLRKVGHINMMSLVLFAFGVRFILYSFLTNAWWILPIEILQGITSGMFYPTITSYANVVSPPGTETTVQGLVGAIFEGIGASLGSYIGGRMYTVYGGWNTFRCFGIASLIFCILHITVQCLLKDRLGQIGVTKGKKHVIDD